MADKMQTLKSMTTRQKVTAVIVVVVVVIVIWEVMGLFGGGGGGNSNIRPASTTTNTNKMMPPKTPAMAGTSAGTAMPTAGANANPQQITPQQAQLTQATGASPQEVDLIKMQQETQSKYITALNQLQMLKVSRDIAEANQAIMAAKLASVTSEKKIVDMLTAPTPPSTPEAYAKNLVNPTTAGGPQQATPQTQPQPQPATYTVISVSELQFRWSAVLGHKGSLYSVHVGDLLPPDGSKVVTIDKSGVILEKDGVKTKISLVPLI